jgi:hypothetical protein
VTPRLLSQSHLSCCSPQMACLSGASDLVSDDEVPIPFLYVPSPSDFLIMLWQPPWQTGLPKSPFLVFRLVLLWICMIVMMRFLFRALRCLCAPSTSRPFFLHFPSLCSRSTCPAGKWQMPARVWLTSICSFPEGIGHGHQPGGKIDGTCDLVICCTFSLRV